MRLRELFLYIEPIYVDPRCDLNRELTPSRGGTSLENALLFVYRRLGGGSSYDISEDDRPYAIVCDESFTDCDNVPRIVFADVRRALAYAYFIEEGLSDSKLRLIAVTGTNGKTTTAYSLYQILRSVGKKCGFIGTGLIELDGKRESEGFYSMTTPDPDLLYPALARMQREGCEFCVMEVSSHALTLGKVAPLHFDYALFTNLSPEHLDMHGDMESYYLAKLSLFSAAKCGIFNLDDPYGARAARECPTRVKTFGIINRGDTYCTEIEFSGNEGADFYYKNERVIFKVRSPLIGAYNVYNLSLAILTAIELGIPPCRVKEAASRVRAPSGRLEVIHRDPTVIIDYAHTPDGVENTLKTIKKQLSSGQRLIAVFGCGGERDRSKRRLMAIAAGKYADLSVVTEDNSRGEDPEQIYADIIEGFDAKDRYVLIKDRASAIRYAIRIAGIGDTVAILGKGHEKYIIDGGGYREFDERAIALASIRRSEDD
ncbi:MAG: UDP-N-acetylmuramoyl-L-alanyl-D-glutamate--2,6-diaminopimelate ligase [Clostridia bacterium]|nr:UDP-N-acetylmuramoyl-L-alanyl-D-glutamate--2,6-diaminopimelate ligase [Clostridia bacterium]